jgi:hypothetical protein
MTGTLEGLDLEFQELGGNNDLLKTIRCPRNLNMISERMPAPQYKQQRIKKCHSLSIDGSSNNCIKIEKDKKVSSEIELLD